MCVWKTYWVISVFDCPKFRKNIFFFFFGRKIFKISLFVKYLRKTKTVCSMVFRFACEWEGRGTNFRPTPPLENLVCLNLCNMVVNVPSTIRTHVEDLGKVTCVFKSWHDLYFEKFHVVSRNVQVQLVRVTHAPFNPRIMGNFKPWSTAQ